VCGSLRIRLLDNRDQVFALHGAAAVGRTTALGTVHAIAARRHDVVGLAPTAKAAISLAESGIESKTLQAHLVRAVDPAAPPTFYVLDEAGLADTHAVKDFVTGLRPEDRSLLVGDTRSTRPSTPGSRSNS
jgi:ATP-dependent exoDNAse (exonuclease V) alpha subunit